MGSYWDVDPPLAPGHGEPSRVDVPLEPRCKRCGYLLMPLWLRTAAGPQRVAFCEHCGEPR